MQDNLKQNLDVICTVYARGFGKAFRNALEERPADDQVVGRNRERRMTAQRELYKPTLLTVMNVGTNPPEKNIVNVTSSISGRRRKKSLRDRGYAMVTVSATFTSVPKNTIHRVFP